MVRLPWRGTPLVSTLALMLCALVLVFHALYFGFITDDAYITFVYAKNWAAHGMPVFNVDHAPVEGYTNFLWMALLAAHALVGLSLEKAALFWGIGFGIGNLCLVTLIVRNMRATQGWLELIPAAFLALSSGFACWSSGGLETQMFVFWILLATWAYVQIFLGESRRWLVVGVALACANLTRPEGLLVAGFFALHTVVTDFVLASKDHARWKAALHRWDTFRGLGIAAFALIFVPWFAWRWWYYGHPFPNTYYVKAAGPASPGYQEELVKNGWFYLGQWAKQSDFWLVLPWLLLASIAAWRTVAWRFLLTLLAPMGLAYAAYTVRVGGDFMGLHRFVMPLFAITALATAAGMLGVLELLRQRWPQAKIVSCGVIALMVATLLAHGVRQSRVSQAAAKPGNYRSDHGIDTPAFLQVYTSDRAKIGKAMQTCVLPHDFAIYGGVGAQPFFAGLQGIDVFGLVSSRIAHEVPRTRPRPGHNKWAPDRLLLEHNPDFVFSCYDIHKDPNRPKWNCDPNFWQRNGYEAKTLHVPGLVERGEYYSFWVKKTRQFDCPGLVMETSK